MAATIGKSVGRGGVNRAADVNVVKRLLNDHLTHLRRSTPLLLDGVVDEATINAISQFQRAMLGVPTPDGRVDPNGATLRALRAGGPSFEQLPHTGDGFYTYGSAAKRWGTPSTLTAVARVARAVRQELSLEIGIGNISLRLGGKMEPHASHRRGVDVDVRPLRTDGQRSPVTIDNSAYDRARTRTLVEILRREPTLGLILFNDTTVAGVRSAAGHHNHLHVRFDG